MSCFSFSLLRFQFRHVLFFNVFLFILHLLVYLLFFFPPSFRLAAFRPSFLSSIPPSFLHPSRSLILLSPLPSFLSRLLFRYRPLSLSPSISFIPLLSPLLFSSSPPCLYFSLYHHSCSLTLYPSFLLFIASLTTPSPSLCKHLPSHCNE